MKYLKTTLLIFILLNSNLLLAQWSNPIQPAYNKNINSLYVANQKAKNIVRYNLGTYKIDTLISGFTKPNGVYYEKLPLGEGIVVLDSHQVKLYNPAGGFIITQSVAGAIEINDLAMDTAKKALYFTDRRRGYIYKLTFGAPPFYTPTIVNFITTGIKKPNGLYFNNSDKHLYVTSMDSGIGLHKIDIKTKKITDLNTAFKGPIFDIGKDNEDNYYVTSWRTNYLYQFQNDFKKQNKIFLENKPAGIILASKIDELIQVCYNCNKVYRIKLHDFGCSVYDKFCQSDSFKTYKKPFKSLWGTFKKGNEFKLELSDKFGSFKNPSVQKIVKSTSVPLLLNGILKGTSDKSGLYKVRWTSTKPKIISESTDLVIKALPFKSKAFVTSQAEICQGDSLKLGTLDSSLYNYKWAPNNENTAFINIKPLVNNTYTLTTTDTTTNCSLTDSVKVVLTSKPDLTNLKNNYDTCKNSDIEIGLDKQNSYKYLWSPSTFLNQTNSSKAIFNGKKNMSYQLTVSAGLCLASDSVHIKITQLTNVLAGLDTLKKCNNKEAFLFKDFPVINGHKWIYDPLKIKPINTGVYAINTQSEYLYILGTYKKCEQKDSVYVYVYPTTKPVLTYNKTTSTLKATQGFSEYKWYKDSVLLKTTTKNNIVISADAKYYVKVTSKNGCENLSDEQLYTIISLKSIIGEGISIYPNPASSVITINSNSTIQGLTLTDINGKTLLIKKGNYKRATLNVSTISTGLYIITIKQDKKLLYYKIVIN